MGYVFLFSCKRLEAYMPLGFGFENAGHTPAIIREVCNFLRYHTPGGVYIVGGVAAHWRTHSRDADRNPEFVDMYTNHFDAISPWTIGRYKDEEEADHFAEQVMKGDIEFLKKKNDGAEMTGEKKIDYIPVVFPGGSVSLSSNGLSCTSESANTPHPT